VLGQLRTMFAVEELRKRILFTIGMLLIFRLGSHIPVPGVDTAQVGDVLSDMFGEGLFEFIGMFTGGALEQFSLFALGVIPYINASIIFSLLIPVFPKLKALQQQGREGRRKLTQYTRWTTVGLALMQAYGMTMVVSRGGLVDPDIPVALFFMTSVIAMTAGTIFLMWIGERITENGIGSGVSMIIMAGIVARFPAQLGRTYLQISEGAVSPFWGIGLIVVFVAVIAGAVVVQQGQRKIPIQYAKRTSGRRVYGGHTTHLPIRVNQGGVIPIIFASAILQLPGSIASWTGQDWLMRYVSPGSLPFLLAYVMLIFFFTYFYSSLVFDPADISKNLRQSGGFVPGVRPGQPTAQYLSRVSGRLLLVGAAFLAFVAVMPYIFTSISGIDEFYLGGTSLLILVGVGIDTIMQIEAHLVMRQYESLVKGTGFLGRRAG